MNEKTRKIVLGVALLAAIIWGYSNRPWERKAPPVPASAAHAQPASAISQPATDRTAAPQAQARSQQSATITEAQLARAREAVWGVDPFYRGSMHNTETAATGRTSRPVYRLKGIVYNETAPSAYINNQSVRVGDTIDGATVVRINRRSVELKRGTDLFTIKVNRG